MQYATSVPEIEVPVVFAVELITGAAVVFTTESSGSVYFNWKLVEPPRVEEVPAPTAVPEPTGRSAVAGPFLQEVWDDDYEASEQ